MPDSYTGCVSLAILAIHFFVRNVEETSNQQNQHVFNTNKTN